LTLNFTFYGYIILCGSVDIIHLYCTMPLYGRSVQFHNIPCVTFMYDDQKYKLFTRKPEHCICITNLIFLYLDVRFETYLRWGSIYSIMLMDFNHVIIDLLSMYYGMICHSIWSINTFFYHEKVPGGWMCLLEPKNELEIISDFFRKW